ncbi:HNH endonuclease [Pseudomonas sp. L13]|uniref:HNH endonuclease n=1 Tax=Pseudomonas sp. L13 TaxID=343985 RepID=UPI001379EF65|nr:HNH endonuclease [Pseudomonas sp. L13]
MISDFEKRHKILGENFFSEYIDVKSVTLHPGKKKRYLGGVINKVCRFCNLGEGETTFKKEAHAIPLLIGNKTLIDNLECDSCNKHFGDNVEDSFGKYFHPHRVMNRIRGRKPLKYSEDKKLKVTVNENRDLNVEVSPVADGDEPVYVRVKDDLLKFTLERQPYYPTAIYKTFVKMALAMMPESERFNVEFLKGWLLSKEQSQLMVEQKVIVWKIPGPSDPDTIRCMLCKTKLEYESLNIKYVLVFAFSGLQFQIPIPVINKNPRAAMPLAPSLRPIDEYKEFGEPAVDVVDFSSNKLVKNEKVEIFFRAEESQV